VPGPPAAVTVFEQRLDIDTADAVGVSRFMLNYLERVTVEPVKSIKSAEPHKPQIILHDVHDSDLRKPHGSRDVRETNFSTGVDWKFEWDRIDVSSWRFRVACGNADREKHQTQTGLDGKGVQSAPSFLGLCRNPFCSTGAMPLRRRAWSPTERCEPC
jgi:hypothetical protein